MNEITFDLEGMRVVLKDAVEIMISAQLGKRLVHDLYKGVNPFDSVFDWTDETMGHRTCIGVLFGVNVMVNNFYKPNILIVTTRYGNLKDYLVKD